MRKRQESSEFDDSARPTHQEKSRSVGRQWYDAYFERDEEIGIRPTIWQTIKASALLTTLRMSLNLKRVIIYSTFVIFVISVGVIYFIVRPDPYISKLRTQYSDDLISEADKAKLNPLEYNVRRLIFEEALDVFLNPELTTEERKQIAHIILDKESAFGRDVEEGVVSKSRAQRTYEKFERAKAIGLTALYLSKLRTQHNNALISDADKAKFTPLEYNVSSMSFEDGLDVFLVPEATKEDRMELAPILADKYDSWIKQFEDEEKKSRATVSRQVYERVMSKIEEAMKLGIVEMAQRKALASDAK